MNRAAIVLAVNVLVVALAVEITRADTLQFDAPDGWVIVNAVEDQRRGYSVTQFAPAGQTVEAWTELLTVEDLARWSVPNEPFLMMHSLKTHMQGRCGTSTFWNVLERRNNSIVYEWKTSNCSKERDQHAMVKILYGPVGRVDRDISRRGEGTSAGDKRLVVPVVDVRDRDHREMSLLLRV